MGIDYTCRGMAKTGVGGLGLGMMKGPRRQCIDWGVGSEEDASRRDGTARDGCIVAGWDHWDDMYESTAEDAAFVMISMAFHTYRSSPLHFSRDCVAIGERF